MELATMVYVWCGVLTGACGLSLICILILFLMLGKLKHSLKMQPDLHKQQTISALPRPGTVPSYNYGNSRITPGEELSHRGYAAHTPEISKPSPLESSNYASDYDSPPRQEPSRNLYGEQRPRPMPPLPPVSLGGRGRAPQPPVSSPQPFPQGKSNPNFYY